MHIPAYGLKSLVSSFLLETGTGGTASTRRKDGRGAKRGRDEDDTNRRPDTELEVSEILEVPSVDGREAVTKKNQVRSTVDVAGKNI